MFDVYIEYWLYFIWQEKLIKTKYMKQVSSCFCSLPSIELNFVRKEIISILVFLFW